MPSLIASSFLLGIWLSGLFVVSRNVGTVAYALATLAAYWFARRTVSIRDRPAEGEQLSGNAENQSAHGQVQPGPRIVDRSSETARGERSIAETSEFSVNETVAGLESGSCYLLLRADTDGMITWVHPTFHGHLGNSSEGLVGQNLETLVANVDPPYDSCFSFAEQMATGLPTQLEIRTCDSVGEHRWLQIEIHCQRDSRMESRGFIAIASDITHLRGQINSLARAQQFMASALDAMSHQVAIIDRTGVILGINSAWRRETARAKRNGRKGQSGCEVGANYLESLTHFDGESVEDSRVVASQIRQILSGDLTGFAIEFPMSIDARCYCELRVSQFRVDEEIFAIVAFEDITQRKQTELTLAEKEKRLRSVYEGSSDAIMLLNHDGFFDCNTKTLEMFGVESLDEFRKLHPTDLSPPLQADFQDSAVKAEMHISKAMQNGSNRFEWLHQDRKGNVFPAEVFLTAFEYEGQRALQASVRDISERKRAEAELTILNGKLQADLEARTRAEKSLREATLYLDVYRKIVDHHAIVAETDCAGNIVHANDAFCKISGFTREELIGKNHRILNSGHHPKSMWIDMYRTVLKKGFWHGEVCNRAKNGELYWVDTTIAPLYDEKNKIRGYFAIRADISMLKKTRAAAEAASLAKSEFLANMSHEIRTPMTAILGYADIIAEESYTETDGTSRLDCINTIKRNGEHLLAIINDILDLSKIEANKLLVERMAVSPAQLVKEVVQLMEVKSKAKGIALRAHLDPSVPPAIMSDPTRLRQILVNLIGNSIKFTEHGCVSVMVKFEDGDDPKLQFSIDDTGIGMSPEHLSNLFEAFAQADASTSRRFGGTGLGLRISKRLAEMLGGDILVSSTLGEGSTFTLTVSAEPSLESGEESPSNSLGTAHEHKEPKGNATPDAQPLRGVRILLAEDGLDNQRLIRFQLTRAGAEVAIAENGRIAIEMMSENARLDAPLLDPLPFDLVISDMQMPVMGGYESVACMRQKGFTGPILALTAHAMDRDREKCLEAGCDSHLTKPINKVELISTCTEWSKRSATQQTQATSHPA